MVFRRRCPGCRRPHRGATVCPGCAVHLLAAPPAPQPPPGVDELLVLHRYDRVVRAMVLVAKNGGRRRLLADWGNEVGRLVGAAADQPPDVITWVPASRQGRRRRGYDQGRQLARGAAASSGRPAARLLIRRPGPARTGADRRERLDGPPLRCPIVAPPRVLLVDDVLTTGASLGAAALALRRAGAVSVTAAVVAAAGTNRDLWPRDHGRQMN